MDVKVGNSGLQFPQRAPGNPNSGFTFGLPLGDVNPPRQSQSTQDPDFQAAFRTQTGLSRRRFHRPSLDPPSPDIRLVPPLDRPEPHLPGPHEDGPQQGAELELFGYLSAHRHLPLELSVPELEDLDVQYPSRRKVIERIGGRKPSVPAVDVDDGATGIRGDRQTDATGPLQNDIQFLNALSLQIDRRLIDLPVGMKHAQPM